MVAFSILHRYGKTSCILFILPLAFLATDFSIKLIKSFNLRTFNMTNKPNVFNSRVPSFFTNKKIFISLPLNYMGDFSDMSDTEFNTIKATSQNSHSVTKTYQCNTNKKLQGKLDLETSEKFSALSFWFLQCLCKLGHTTK